MCGICGVVSTDGSPVVELDLTPMNDAMRLRGPDDSGVWADGRAALGHRRLSIIDLASGHQPLGNEDGMIQVVLNGEIYNFVSLRKELEGKGHHFRTRSDTEVIVHAYEEWGEESIGRLDGMFALALWDSVARRLLLARDRFGKKPLVWFQTRGCFAFASTITALTRHPLCPRTVSRDALARYFALEFVPSPDSILEGVQKLEAGRTLTVEADGAVTIRRYWKPAVAGVARVPDDIDEQIRGRLVEAVRKRLVADVPIGIFLSGGIDSSSVVAAAAHAGAGKIRTFSIGFRETSFDESSWARKVAAHFGTEHVEETLDPAQLLEIVPHLGSVLDEPMADPSVVPTYLLSRLARRHVTVALGGDGGDELFAGYPTYVAHQLAGPASAVLKGPLLSFARALARRLPVSHQNVSLDFKIKTMLDGLAVPKAIRNYVWLGAFRQNELASLLDRDPAESLAPVRSIYEEAPGRTHLERVLYQDVMLYLNHLILAKVDRASMANSLEVRAPFLDTAFAEFVFALPLREKISGLKGKISLKRAVQKWLPAEIVHRKKKGFGMPIGAWLRGPLEALLRSSMLDTHGLAATGLVSRPFVEQLIDEHRRGAADHRKRLWSLLVFELWRQDHSMAQS